MFSLFHIYVVTCALSDHVEGAVRLTEARLRQESTEGKIIDFKQTEGGFEVVRLAAINGPQSKASVINCNSEIYCIGREYSQ